jgi:deoxyribose-phosphate aldolase
MVLQIGALRSGRDSEVQADIEAIVEVAHGTGALVKVVFENAYLSDDEKVRACRLSQAAGTDFVKTSTGFGPGGATHQDLALMRANTSPHIQVKAGGGVRTLDALSKLLRSSVPERKQTWATIQRHAISVSTSGGPISNGPSWSARGTTGGWSPAARRPRVWDRTS